MFTISVQAVYLWIACVYTLYELGLLADPGMPLAAGYLLLAHAH